VSSSSQPVEFDIPNDGIPCDVQMEGLPLRYRAYAFPGGYVAIYDPLRKLHVDLNILDLNILDMTEDEIEQHIEDTAW
jgi:hypothetical protein